MIPIARPLIGQEEKQAVLEVWSPGCWPRGRGSGHSRRHSLAISERAAGVRGA